MLDVVPLLAPALFLGLCAGLVPLGVVTTVGTWRQWATGERMLVALPCVVLAVASTTAAVVGMLQRDPNAMCGVLGLCPLPA